MRTHDNLYLGENRYDDVKESFKFCRGLARSVDRGCIYDFGSAAGEFASYLAREFPNNQVHGVDLLPNLIEKARERVPEAKFTVGSVLDRNAFPPNISALSFLVGVHSIFDDPTEAFDNVIHWTKPQGQVVIFGMFNPLPVDAYIRVRVAGSTLSHREPGWNMISQATVSDFLDAHKKVRGHRYEKFSIPIDLPPQDDPLRSWTEKLADGSRQIINGIGLRHEFYALVVDL